MEIVLSDKQRNAKLSAIIDYEGYDGLDGLLEACVFDSVCPAICCNESCNFIEHMEGDQREGWCAKCDTNSMQSALVLAEMI